ncbi:uncharacterized protein LOC143229360 isoform X2 [Tachypleus tridentatus]|uniref:uncharacterized protein LOC143229360 isoform X2 n=1 Tax=Tachypleus tridentatus TaxID=6853 RepID=UPI003FD1778D
MSLFFFLALLTTIFILFLAAEGEPIVSRETLSSSPVISKQEVSKQRLLNNNKLEPAAKGKSQESNITITGIETEESQDFQRSSPENSGTDKKKERSKRPEKKKDLCAKESKLSCDGDCKEKLEKERIVKKQPEVNLHQSCISVASRSQKKRNQKNSIPPVVSGATTTATIVSSNYNKEIFSNVGGSFIASSESKVCICSNKNQHKESNKDVIVNGMKSTPDLDDFGVISGNAERDEEKQKNKVSTISSLEKLMVEPHSDVSERPQSPTTTVFSIRGLSPLTTLTSPKKGHRREEGWKEVVRRSKKISVPSSAISRVIGKGGCNINTICEVSGAHIEVEKQKGQGDRTLIIRFLLVKPSNCSVCTRT